MAHKVNHTLHERRAKAAEQASLNRTLRKQDRANHRGRSGKFGLEMALGGTVLVVGGLGLLLHERFTDDSKEEPACVYIVQPGDRLSELAHDIGGLTDDLVEANGGTAAITPGQQLQLGKAACDTLAELGTQLQPLP